MRKPLDLKRVWLTDDPPGAAPGRVLHILRRHRGPSDYIVLWPDGAESVFARDEIETRREPR